MTTLLIVLAAFLWWFSGFASFVYWWRHSYDLTTTDFTLAVGAGLIGPIAFVVGALIHGNNTPTIILPKRTPKP